MIACGGSLTEEDAVPRYTDHTPIIDHLPRNFVRLFKDPLLGHQGPAAPLPEPILHVVTALDGACMTLENALTIIRQVVELTGLRLEQLKADEGRVLLCLGGPIPTHLAHMWSILHYEERK